SSSDTSITPSTVAASPRLTTFGKGKQAAKASKAKSLSALSKVAMTEAQQLKLVTKRSLQQTHISQASGFGVDEGTGSIPGVPDVPSDESKEELYWNFTDEEGDDDEGKDGEGDEDEKGDDGEEGDGDDDDEDDDEEGRDDAQEYDEEIRDEESFDPIPKTPENSDDEGNGEEDLGLNVGREEGHNEEEDEDKLYRDSVNEQLEAKVVTRSSHSSKTSYAVVADLLEIELKKILIEKMEGNKPDRGSKRRREGKELESASAPTETATRSAEDQPIIQSSQHPNCDWNKTMLAIHGSIQPWISKLVKQTDFRSYFNKLMDIPLDFSNFLINRLKVDTLTLELLAGPTYELMKGSCKSLFYGFAVNRESARDVYSKRRIIVFTELKIIEWHNYKHLDGITMRRDDD
nr:hypothetical protein [Tanacetum cinerariifolium]